MRGPCRGAAAGGRLSRFPRGDAADLARWAGSARFSRARLRGAYVVEEIDGFLEAIRDTFLGVRQPPLTAGEVRGERFLVTLQGYDQKEVDVFLAEAAARLLMRCAECGAFAAEATRACAGCGAPPVVRRPAAAGLGDGRQTAPAAARDARRPPAWIRRGQPYFVVCLIFFLVLYLIGVAGFNATVQSGSHHPMEWIIQWSIVGALLSVILFEAARNQFRVRQVVWGLVPVLSFGLLAFARFLWLALVRRRARDWAVFAAYLAAVATGIVFGGPVYQVGAVQLELGLEILAGLLVIASLQAVLAFSPAAGPATFRAARAASGHQEPATGAVVPQASPRAAGPAT